MKRTFGVITLLFVFLAIHFMLAIPHETAQAQQGDGETFIIGRLEDPQNQPVVEAEVSLIGESGQVLSTAQTQPNGRFALLAPSDTTAELEVHIDRAHFQSASYELSQRQIDQLRVGQTLTLPLITLRRSITPAFWLATATFILVLILVATGLYHNTLATLIGVTIVFTASYLGSAISDGLFIFDFERSLTYIDWNVIFLVMGMMIVIAVVENTGIFQWLAFFAYRISRGKAFILLPILMLITGVASAFLDNVTTMLLMTPITVQIALALDVNPLTFLLPEVMASNVIGVSTLVGTPTNIMIGSFAGISFSDFLTNLTPGVLLAFIGLVIYSAIIYRADLSSARTPSPKLMERLEERGQIREPDNLMKAGVVGALMILLFTAGEGIHLLPAVTAIMGATALLVWIRPDIEEMIEAVDWTTLVFFLALFITVGAIQEVGLISLIADFIGRLVGDSLILAILGVTWLSAFLSMVIANIPFTAAMLPVVGFLSRTVPGATSNVLFYCLSVGSAMGGNGSLIGASANLVTAGISESAGYPISYARFLKRGLPAMIITVAMASLWLFVHFM